MSAVAVASRGRGWEDAGRAGAGIAGAHDERPAQPRLFAVAGAAVAAAPEAPARAPTRVRTLDDVLTGAWSLVAAGTAAPCPICAGRLTPRWSAGAGAVGARC